MSEVPDNLKFTKEHEWIRPEEDGTVVVGITDYAQESLGDVTFVELPEVGAAYAAGETFGVVESVKAASDLFMPLAGEVVEINEALAETPEEVNASPFERAWMIRVRPDNPSDLDRLLDAEAYRGLVV